MSIDCQFVYFRCINQFFIIFGMLGAVFSLVSDSVLINYVAVIAPVFMVGLYIVRKYALLWFLPLYILSMSFRIF